MLTAVVVAPTTATATPAAAAATAALLSRRPVPLGLRHLVAQILEQPLLFLLVRSRLRLVLLQ